MLNLGRAYGKRRFQNLVLKVESTVERLQFNQPLPKSQKLAKLKGRPDVWYCRLGDDLRLIFDYASNDEIRLIDIGTHAQLGLD